MAAVPSAYREQKSTKKKWQEAYSSHKNESKQGHRVVKPTHKESKQGTLIQISVQRGT